MTRRVRLLDHSSAEHRRDGADGRPDHRRPGRTRVRKGHLMTTGTAPGPTLAELSDEERNERFDRLQERMRGVWEIMRHNEEDESVVVIPSVSVDRVNERNGSLQQAYEERFLVLLLLLRQPRLRIIYVTSMPIAPKIVEYYLALLTEVIPNDL
jgi:hypothetical protein